MTKRIYIKIPASIGNMGSGFDCAGLSLKFYNEFTVTRAARMKISFSDTHYSVSSKNVSGLFSRAFAAGLKYYGENTFPVEMAIENKIPFKRGFGSSATVVLAAVISGLLFAGRRIIKKEVLRIAFPFEGHIDNLAASLYGGFVLGGNEGKTVVRIPAPEMLRVIAFVPGEGLSTKSARDILPDKVPLSDAVYNMANYGMLCSAFFLKDMSILKFGLRDRLHQPYRSKIIPHLEGLTEREISPYVIGACLSGAGPSVVFFATDKNVKKALSAVTNAINEKNINGDIHIIIPGGRTIWKIIE